MCHWPPGHALGQLALDHWLIWTKMPSNTAFHTLWDVTLLVCRGVITLHSRDSCRAAVSQALGKVILTLLVGNTIGHHFLGLPWKQDRSLSYNKLVWGQFSDPYTQHVTTHTHIAKLFPSETQWAAPNRLSVHLNTSVSDLKPRFLAYAPLTETAAGWLAHV